MLTPSTRFLFDAVDARRRLNAGRLQDGRHHVDDVVKLVALFTSGAILRGHETASPLRVPPKWEATCFIHWKGASSARPSPRCSGFRTARCRSRPDERAATQVFGRAVERRGTPRAVDVPSADAPLSPQM